MKNSTSLFRSLAIITLIAGAAHLVTYASQSIVSMDQSVKEIVDKDTLSSEEYQLEYSSKRTRQNYDENIDYIAGKWKVTYNTKEFKGAIIYIIKKEGKIYNAYTYKYEDEDGNSEKAEGSKILIVKKFNGYKGKGVYTIQYEGQQYDVKCNISIVDENTFKVSYDYYGYGDVETWKRQ